MQQRRRSDDGKQRGNPWSGLENESKEVGSQRKNEKKEVQSEIPAPKELHEGGVKKLLRAGMVYMQWEMAPTERLKLRTQMAAAAGKKSTTALSLFRSGRRALYPAYPDLGRWVHGLANGTEQKEA